MTIKINGTNTTAQPSITGTDTDTGLVYGTDQVQVVTGGTTRVTVDGSGNVTTTGSATFAGNVDLGNVNTSSNSNTGSKLETSGQLLLQLSSSVGAGNQNGIAVYYGNALKTTIKNDGTANFAGTVKSLYYQAEQTNSANAVFLGRVGSSGSYTSIINADGSSTFDGNVTSKSTFLNELQTGYSATDSAFKVFHGGSTFGFDFAIEARSAF